MKEYHSSLTTMILLMACGLVFAVAGYVLLPEMLPVTMRGITQLRKEFILVPLLAACCLCALLYFGSRTKKDANRNLLFCSLSIIALGASILFGI